jgi:hypothetical protein
MKKILNILSLLFIAALATSCLYGKGFGEEAEVENTSGFKAEVSANVIIANGEDTAVFRALLNGEDVTAQSTLYNAQTDEALEGMSFTTFTPGIYTFYVVYDQYRSEVITVTAVQNIDLTEKEESGLSAIVSTNLIQVGRSHAAFIIRYDGKVLSADEIRKVSIYDATNDAKIEISEENTVGSEFSYVAATDESGTYLLLAYSPNTAGTREFWFGYKTKNTRETPIAITAVTSNIPSRPADAEPSNTNFVHRALFTQFTGTWCGNCPYMIAAFHYMFEDPTYKDKFIHTAVHNGDVFKVVMPDGRDLSNILNTTGSYPYVLCNLTTGIQNSQVERNVANLMGAIEGAMKSEARAGIAARTELKDNMLLVRASVKVSHTSEYYIGAWLVESDLHALQSNYTDMKDDYIDVHENVVRIADSNTTNFMGHSLGTITKGDRADHLFVMELDPSWKTENCHLVLFVSTIQFNSLSMTNAVKTTSLTSGVDFEYMK